MNFKIKLKIKRKRNDEKELDDNWKNIPGFPHYQINKFGQVKRISAYVTDCHGISFYRKGGILKSRKTKLGYVQVDMCEDGISYGRFVHVLLAKVFIPNPNNFPLVNHKDENPSNNSLDNLEWCDYSYNSRYSMKKIIESHKKEMRAVIRINPLTKEETKYIGIREAGRQNNVNHSNIRYAILHNSRCCNYFWKYE